MYRKFSMITIGALLFVLGTGAGGILQAKTIKWKAQSLFAPEDASTSVQAQSVVDSTNAALEGKLETKLFQSGQLIPPEEMVPGLARGVYDAAIMVPMMVEPAGIVAFGLPYSFEGYDQLKEFWFEHGFDAFMREMYAKKGIYYVGPLPFGPVSLLSKFPVRKIEDIKGKKIWTEGPLAHLVEALGGQPVWFDPGEVYMGLKLGTIDGIFFGWAELETIKLKEVVDYVMTPSILNPVNFDWIVSMRSWKKLTPEMQQAYMKAFRDNILPQYKKSMAVCQQGLDAAKAYGIEVIDLDEAEQKKFREASLKVWDGIAQEDENSAAAIKMIKDYLKAKGLIR